MLFVFNDRHITAAPPPTSPIQINEPVAFPTPTSTNRDYTVICTQSSKEEQKIEAKSFFDNIQEREEKIRKLPEKIRSIISGNP